MYSSKTSILFWNLWFENQAQTKERLDKLERQLDEILKLHSPDHVALSEVLRETGRQATTVHNVLAENGYESVYFAPGGPYNEKFEMGCLLASRVQPIKVTSQVLGYDIAAHHRGFEGNDTEYIRAKFTDYELMVVHLVNITPARYRTHMQHQQNLLKAVKSNPEKLIIVGDLNEPRKMPNSFARKSKGIFRSKTGRYKNPTWRHANRSLSPLRSNLDKVFWPTGNEIELETFRIIDGKVSDHQPILASFLIEA